MYLKLASITSIAAAILALGAGAASAHTLPPGAPAYTASTQLTDRPDSGNGSPDPYWADDTLTRDLTITLTGHTGSGANEIYDYSATLADAGTFTTIKGALTPNQDAAYLGDTINSRVTGKMKGYADFTFTATSL